MECNKEEAIKAQQMAEKKMENKDFVSARKIALKAQSLYPNLDNISQMIMVCDVHCSAEAKKYGNDKDWYGILKLESTADEASIKKQYRKFALILHPDKNKFAGADDAFKLIGEAQRVLLDLDKRRLHDMMRSAAGRLNVPNRAPHQASGHSNTRNPPWVHNNFTSSMNPPGQQPPPPQENYRTGFYNNKATFWTACPFCSVQYEFYTDVLNKLLTCQSCLKSFTGFETKKSGATIGTNWARPTPTNMGHNQGPPINIYKKVEPMFKAGEGFVPHAKFTSVNNSKKRQQKKESKSYGKMNGKRRRRVAESSESSSSESSSESEEDDARVAESSESCKSESSTDPDEEVAGKRESNIGKFDERYPRRSTRSKRNVSYSENLSDDDEVTNPSKISDGSIGATKEEKVQDSEKNVQRGEQIKTETAVNEDDNIHSHDEDEPKTYEYPDPDFSDFDKERKEDCFAVGQIWAVYDPPDALPRFYAQIKKVFSTGFKLKITWLEPFPNENSETKWVDAGLPVSCGNYMYGKTETTQDLPMFSHMVYWGKGSGKDIVKIYPLKGETWALFKNWDINWSLDPDNKQENDYEFVEVLSSFDEHVGIRVAHLSKVKGFACLFCRTSESGEDSFQIPAKEMFRFSHRVPSYQMTGEEREDVPKGSFELDPAALPTNLAIPEIIIQGSGRVHPNGQTSRGK